MQLDPDLTTARYVTIIPKIYISAKAINEKGRVRNPSDASVYNATGSEYFGTFIKLMLPAGIVDVQSIDKTSGSACAGFSPRGYHAAVTIAFAGKLIDFRGTSLASGKKENSRNQKEFHI